MAESTKCLTDGAIYRTHIHPRNIAVTVNLPFQLDISEEEAEILETLLHNQLEVVLIPYFKQDKNKSDINCPTHSEHN